MSHVVKTCRLDGSDDGGDWKTLGYIVKLLYKDDQTPFLALNIEGSVYEFGHDDKWKKLPVSRALDICHQCRKSTEAGIIATVDGCFISNTGKGVELFSDLHFHHVASGVEATFGVTKDGELYGWGKNSFLGLILDGLSDTPVRLDQFDNVVGVECGEEHTIILVERPANDLDDEDGEEESCDLDDGLHFGINILEDAMAMARQETQKPDVVDGDEKSSRMSLMNSVEWFGQSTLNATSVILPSPVTKMITSTIATTTSTISSTYSYGESIIKSFLPSQPTRQKIKTDSVFGIKHAPTALTDLWVWGRNGHGQLGTGDTVDVIEPVRLGAVSAKGIVAIMGKGNQSFALTSTWEVWAWGEGFQKETKIKIGNNVLHTMSPGVFSVSINHGGYQLMKGADISTDSTYVVPAGAVLTSTFQYHYQLVTCPMMKCVAELARMAKSFSRDLGVLRKNIVRPLLNECQSTGTFNGFNTDLSSVFGLLCTAFNQLTVATTQNAAGGHHWVNYRASLFIILSSSAESLVMRFITYFRFLGKAVVGGFFDSLNKDFVSRLEPKLKNVEDFGNKQSGFNVPDLLIDALSSPVKELKNYIKVLETLQDLTTTIEGPEDPQRVDQVSVTLVHGVIERLKVAVVDIQCITEDFRRTRIFWNDGQNLKYRKTLVTADRFLVMTNKKIPVWPHGAVTQPAVLLFSDVLVIWTQLSVQYLPLNLLWIAEYPDELRVTVQTPEETLTLVFRTPEDRDFWCQSLIQSVCRLLESSDLTRLPIHRKGLFQFKSGRLRGCTYMGDWENGKMHGKGFITSPDHQKKYVGCFYENERNGWGVFTNEAAKDNDIKCYTGFYKKELQNGIGEAEYGDGGVYKGCWSNGVRAGHGVMFYSFSHAVVYLGDWEDNKRNGYGVLRSRLQGWRFLCLWKDDKKHGRGVFVSSDSIFTQSMFSFDQIIDKEGLVYVNLTNINGIEEDRFFVGSITSSQAVTVVDDMIQPEAVTLVKGKLSILHDSRDADKLATSVEGNFSGNILEPKIVAGHNFQTKIVDANLTAFFNLVGTIPGGAKWKGLFHLMVSELGTPLTGPDEKWSQQMTDDVWVRLRDIVSDRRTTMFSDVEPKEVLALTQKPTSIDQVKEYISNALLSRLHPLGHVMSMIVKAFESSYTPAHTAMIFAALAEIKSIIKLFHNVVRCFFPGVDPVDPSFCAGTLILPSLFPQVYPVLQAMYVASHSRVEERINQNLRRYRTMKDLSLAQLLGSEILDKMVIDADHKPILLSCVRKMRQFPLCILPDQKLDLVCELFKDLKTHLAKYNASYSADDLLPAMEFVMVRGMVTNLGVEIRIIKDFIHPDIQGGERGLWYCHFYTAYKSLSR